MLRFNVYCNGALATEMSLDGAYVFGQDGVPVSAKISFSDGVISIEKRVAGACGLTMLWDAGKSGRCMMPTTRLPDREEPYNLNLEMARGQMMRLVQKREDWGLFDFKDAQKLNKAFELARSEFISALQATDRPTEAASLADKALSGALMLGEKMALFHADIFIYRRKAASLVAAKTAFGCQVDLLSTSDEFKTRMSEAFDFVSIPMPWKHTEPKEHEYRYDEIDSWVSWAVQNKKPIHAGPLLSFDQKQLPEWLYIWEHDYDALRDLIYERIQKVVQRYGSHVKSWKVVAGIHAQNSFNLKFEQLMELTRMGCLLVKNLAPASHVVIDLILPWGEYYARNQRTVPPMMYADMAVQSGIKFDAFGVQLHTGVPTDGHFVRDLLQTSSLLDSFVRMGKSVHITACQAPSAQTPDKWDAWGGKLDVAKAGKWHREWSDRLQAEWLQAFYRVAISKPFVDTICWRDLADYEGHYIPHGGLCNSDLSPKLAYRELRNFKALLAANAVNGQKPANNT